MHCFRFPLSSTCYFTLVAILSVLLFSITLLLRPILAYDVREFIGLQDKRFQPSPNSFYALRVEPIFEMRCNSCHGVERQKGNLRLDSLGRLMLGGRSGPMIMPGNVQSSELVHRITLPKSDEKAMPPEGKMPITEDEVTVVSLWIAAGASGMTPAKDFKNAPPAPVEIIIPDIDLAAVQVARAPLAAAVAALQAKYPGVIAYESRGSADIRLNASRQGEKFENSTLAEFAPLNERIVWADFTGTAITDASAKVIAEMKSLKVLRLRDTRITEKTVEVLTLLEKLESLNVFGVGVAESSLRMLEQTKPVKIYHGEEEPLE